MPSLPEFGPIHRRSRFRWTGALGVTALFVALILLGGPAACGEQARPHVLLVTLDTTRVDHLSCYGYERETSPRLDRLAAASVRYTRAWSTSAWTLPAHASLFTGLFPGEHGAAYAGRSSRPMRDDVPTLAEILSAKGLSTAAFVSGFPLQALFGLDRGFAHYDDEMPSGPQGWVVESIGR